MELQGDGHPLVLADTAVVVGLEESYVICLIQGQLLQIQTGRIDMGRGDIDALLQPLPSDHRQHDGLAPVGLIHLVPGLQLHAPHKGLKPRGPDQRDGAVHTLPLSLARVQELLIAHAVGLHGLQVGSSHPVIAVFLVVGQAAAQLLAPGHFLVLAHKYAPFHF